MASSFVKIKLKQRCRYFAVFLACLTVFALSANLSYAQDKAITETEKAVFAFFSLANATPNYAQWIEGSKAYRNETSMSKRQRLYEEESLRLKWAFAKYEPSEQPLKIKTDILVQLRGTEQDATLNFKFPDSGTTEIPYFPYFYGDEWIALVIEDLDMFTSIPLTPEQFRELSNTLSADSVYSAKIELRIEPTRASIEAPINIDGIEAWFMSGKTRHLAFLYSPPQTEEERVLWSYPDP